MKVTSIKKPKSGEKQGFFVVLNVSASLKRSRIESALVSDLEEHALVDGIKKRTKYEEANNDEYIPTNGKLAI
jgi:hypothetical protein